jgi:hypothetical protein
MEVGLSHPPVKVAWRIVSEDFSRRVTRETAAVASIDDFPFSARSFLLIVRTGRIVTATTRDGKSLDRAVPPDTRSFQHMARFIYVTTTVNLIVTAAVYRGFDQELRPRRD